MVGLWHHLDQYRAAVASRFWLENHVKLAQDDYNKRLTAVIRGRLLAEASLIELGPDENQNATTNKGQIDARKKLRHEHHLELEKIVNDSKFDPAKIKTQLKKDDWKLSLFSKVITEESAWLSRQRHSAIGSYELRKSHAEAIPFKLLGLEFSVNGFWAWTVWLLFFCGGILYLSLSRRALIRRCRSIWSLFADAKTPANETHKLAEPLPLWIRPLPAQEPWVTCLGGSIRLDIALDPLSFLCVSLLVICVFLATLTTGMAAISTSLLRSESNFEWEPFLHAVFISFFYGFSLALLLSWAIVPNDKRSPWLRKKYRVTSSKTEILSRRTLLASSITIAVTALIYLRPINRKLTRLLLRHPRFRNPNSRRRPSERAFDKNKNPIPSHWKSGFYLLRSPEGIHYVPLSGRCRSLRNYGQDQVDPWSGPFDANSLHMVHPSAMVPFLRQAMANLLKGKRHSQDLQQRAKMLATPETQALYREAFNLVLRGIELDEQPQRRRNRRMPNLQLYDLLGAVAINSYNKNLLHIASARIKAIPLPSVPSSSGDDLAKALLAAKSRDQLPKSLNSHEEPNESHSHHARNKNNPNFLARRAQRIAKFQAQRLGRGSLPTTSQQFLPKSSEQPLLHIPGTWNPNYLTPEIANSQHVARVRKIPKHPRSHRHKSVQSFRAKRIF